MWDFDRMKWFQALQLVSGNNELAIDKRLNVRLQWAKEICISLAPPQDELKSLAWPCPTRGRVAWNRWPKITRHKSSSFPSIAQETLNLCPLRYQSACAWEVSHSPRPSWPDKKTRATDLQPACAPSRWTWPISLSLAPSEAGWYEASG